MSNGVKKLLLFTIIFSLLLTGCFHEKEEKVLMDQLAEDGKFHYQNEGLGFAVALPAEFLYYQTQRKETDEFIDLEFFIPTSDSNYVQEVPGYGKPIIIRIFNTKEYWEAVDEADKLSFYHEIGEKDGKIYTMKVWKDLPEDWKWKWTFDMEQEILKSFEIK